ncbi:hypothetical protein BJ878DRAFT_268684 [Calycina marina]|uniref:SET domain-containing protein n=1 Tax=Calycina marina TaxID=1763456 RepID=A0A9P8CBN9_9HELO|nr:hypothetical protein BJ878DRAFT_268684 [Calycina marina]
MSQDVENIRELLAWGNEHDSFLTHSVEIYHDPVTGLSFRTTEDLLSGSAIANCSYPVSLSYLNAIQHPGFPRRSEPFPISFLETLAPDDPNVIGFFFLIQQYLLKEKSFWWPYIRLLPLPDGPGDLNIPVLWSDDDCRFLAGTNAEPPIRMKQRIWSSEWQKGIRLLQEESYDCQNFTLTLYRWAATIFGSRSFRASLVVADGIISGNDPQTLEHVEKDRFSVLLPIVDIGNHNGINNVKWKPDMRNGLVFSNSYPISKGDQIFNYYGNKSNSELLVAYGFMLPESAGFEANTDSVNLLLKPTSHAVALRRQQACHTIPSNIDEEFMFRVQAQGNPKSLVELRHFPHGLVDLILCMVGNEREVKTFLSLRSHLDYCASIEVDLFAGPLYRGSLLVLQILHDKLRQEKHRIVDWGAELGEPQNHNQELAMIYRRRQIRVLDIATSPLTDRLDHLFSSSSLCGHSCHRNPRNQNPAAGSSKSGDAELLSLECAFDWLRTSFPAVFKPVVRMISDDQEESLPLNWAILVEDWDLTYWIIWLFIVLVLLTRSENQPLDNMTSRTIQSWVGYLLSTYRSSGIHTESNLIAEESEQNTVNQMISSILKLPDIACHNLTAAETERLSNTASYIIQEEGMSVDYVMGDGTSVAQRVLCVRGNMKSV